MRAVFDILKILLIERDRFISNILRPDKVAARLRPAGCALLYKFGDILLFLLQPCLVLIVGPPLNIGILIAVKISYIGGFRFSGNFFPRIITSILSRTAFLPNAAPAEMLRFSSSLMRAIA